MRNTLYTLLFLFVFISGVNAADPVLQVINLSPDNDMTAVRVELGDSLIVDSLVFNGATAYLTVQVSAGETLTFISLSDEDATFELNGIATEEDKRYQSILHGVQNVNSYAENPDGISRALSATWVESNGTGVASGQLRVNFFHAVADAIELDVADLLLEYIVDDMGFTSYSANSTDFIADNRSIFFVSSDSVTQIASRAIDLSLLAGPTATIFLSGFIVPVNNLGGPAIQFYIADSDGNVTPLSLLLAVPLSELASNVTVYPNPATDWVAVDLTTSLPGTVGFSLIDITGKVYLQESHEISPGNQHVKLSFPAVDNGLYFIRLDNGESSVAYPLVITH
jgi:hypothetical protein